VDGDAKVGERRPKVKEDEEQCTCQSQYPCRFLGHALESTFEGEG
jgi:hypothetical protein